MELMVRKMLRPFFTVAPAQSPNEDGIRHLHAHMARAGHFVRLRDGHVREVRNGHRPVMPRHETQPHLRHEEQPHDQEGRQEEIPHDPVAQNPLGLGLYLVLAIFLCHGKMLSACQFTKI